MNPISDVTDPAATSHSTALAAPAAVSPPPSDGVVRLSFTGPNSIRKINSAFILRFNEKERRISRVLLCFVFFRKVSLSWKEAWRSRLATSQKKEETDMLHYSCSHIMLE